jgi:hypothetical protein
LAEGGEFLASEDFDFEPDFEFALLGPEPAHIGQRISFDHRPERIRELSGVWKGLNATGRARIFIKAAPPHPKKA